MFEHFLATEHHPSVPNRGSPPTRGPQRALWGVASYFEMFWASKCP